MELIKKKLSTTTTPSTKSTGADQEKKPERYSLSRDTFKPRLISKNGHSNVTHLSPPNPGLKSLKILVERTFFRDFFITLLEMGWRWALLLAFSGFLLSWLFFAILYYIIAYAHGDVVGTQDLQHKPCMSQVDSFVSAFLFSLETQHTIGYGVRSITTECPEAVVLLCIQSIAGTLLQTMLGGLFLAKLLRPKNRIRKIMFSKYGVVSHVDGDLCFMFRVADISSANIIEAHIRCYMARRRVTPEGEIIPLDMQDVNVGFDEGKDRIFLTWPKTIRHKINEKSPLYGLTEEKLKTAEFELIAILEGIVETTGMSTQVRTSYLPSEILWGHRFRQIAYKQDNGNFAIYYAKFDKTLAASETDGESPAFQIEKAQSTEADKSDHDTMSISSDQTDRPTVYNNHIFHSTATATPISGYGSTML